MAVAEHAVPAKRGSRLVEPHIYEIYNKHSTTYKVEVEPNAPVGRFKTIEVARRVRDAHIARYGEPPRRRRAMGMGCVYRRGNRWSARLAGVYIGSFEDRAKAEEAIAAALCDPHAAVREWNCGHDGSVVRRAVVVSPRPETDPGNLNIRDRLRALRIAAGMSQYDVADRCGASQATINYIERGRKAPRLGTLRRICAALGTTLDAVCDGR